MGKDLGQTKPNQARIANAMCVERSGIIYWDIKVNNSPGFPFNWTRPPTLPRLGQNTNITTLQHYNTDPRLL